MNIKHRLTRQATHLFQSNNDDTFEWITVLTATIIIYSFVNVAATDLAVSDICCDLLHWYNPLLRIRPLPRTRTARLHPGAPRTGTSGNRCIPACTQRWIHMSYVLTWLGRRTSLPSLSARRRLCTNCIDVCAILSSDTRFGACSVPAAKMGKFTTPIVPKYNVSSLLHAVRPVG